MWGCIAGRPGFADAPRRVPHACGGVSRGDGVPWSELSSLPHARGGVSHLGYAWNAAEEVCSPRMWGCIVPRLDPCRFRRSSGVRRASLRSGSLGMGSPAHRVPRLPSGRRGRRPGDRAGRHTVLGGGGAGARPAYRADITRDSHRGESTLTGQRAGASTHAVRVPRIPQRWVVSTLGASTAGSVPEEVVTSSQHPSGVQSGARW